MTDYLNKTPAERDNYFAAEAAAYREKKAREAMEREQHVHTGAPPIGKGFAARPASAATGGERDDPLPLRRPPPPGEPFPIDALGLTLGGAARAIADRVQCAPGLAGASTLAAAALAAQAHVDVVIPATGQARPASLFLLSVAESGDRKSSGDYEAMRPIRAREKALREIYEAERPDYVRAKRAYEIALALAEKKAKGDRREIEAALRAVGDPPHEPLLPFLLCQEPSLEGLQKLFERGQASLGLFSDEGGGFVGGYSMSAEHKLKTLAGLSLFWDGAIIRRIRAGDGASALVGKRLAMHLMLQPQIASGLLADSVAVGQGFLSRCLVSAPPSLAGTRMQKPVAPEGAAALNRYSAALRELLEKPALLVPGTNNSLDPRRVCFDARAAASWLRLADTIERKLGPGGEYEPVRGFGNKLAEHVARIAGVLALADDPDAAEIGADALARAATLGDYFAGEALRLFEAGAVTPEIAQAEKLLAWLETWPEPAIGLVAIYQRGPNSIREKEAAQRAVKQLEAHGWLRRLEGSGHKVDGKPVREAWTIVRGRR